MCKERRTGWSLPLVEPSPVEGRGEVDVGKGVSNHCKSGFFFLYPYLFTLTLLH